MQGGNGTPKSLKLMKIREKCEETWERYVQNFAKLLYLRLILQKVDLFLEGTFYFSCFRES